MSRNLNLQGVPTAKCPMCGGKWLTVQVVLDPETYEICVYGLQAECFSCGTLLTLGTPADLCD